AEIGVVLSDGSKPGREVNRDVARLSVPAGPARWPRFPDWAGPGEPGSPVSGPALAGDRVGRDSPRRRLMKRAVGGGQRRGELASGQVGFLNHQRRAATSQADRLPQVDARAAAWP